MCITPKRILELLMLLSATNFKVLVVAWNHITMLLVRCEARVSEQFAQRTRFCVVKLRAGINVDLIRCRMTFDEIFVRSHGAFFRLRSHSAFYPQFTLQWIGRPQ